MKIKMDIEVPEGGAGVILGLGVGVVMLKKRVLLQIKLTNDTRKNEQK